MVNGTQYQADEAILTANDDGRRGGPPRLLVIHTSEGRWDQTTADSLARYQQRPDAGGSYHVIVDGTGRMVRGNDDAYIPWAAGWTGNRAGLHLCAVGTANWSRDDWLARTAMLDRIRDWISYNSTLYGIPAVRLVGTAIDAPARGVCGHADISAAWREVDHWDPGPNFPYDYVTAGDRPAPRTHVVQRGENLYSLARQYGTTVDALVSLNRIDDPSVIRVGQVLKLCV